jgi:outer membrane protein assembly factor BamB
MWSLSTALQLDATGTVIHDDSASLFPIGNRLLLRSTAGTTVIDPGTGRVLWSTAAPVLDGNGGTGVVQETTFAPNTVYDESSGDPGPLYFSLDGIPHTRPPERTVLRGLDLATGRERWRHTERGSVYVVPPGPGAAGFVVISADRITMLSADTGTAVRYRALPKITADSYPDVVGDMVLLPYDGTVRALSLRTFDLMWQHPDRIGLAADRGSCLDLLCDIERSGITVLDPATGDPRWRTSTESLLFARGPDVLEERSAGQSPLAVREAGTGRVRADLTAWDTVAGGEPGDPLLLYRAQPGSARAGVGVLVPGASRVQLLGLTSAPVRDCSADARYVVCRIDDGVEVWAYQA